MDTQIIIGKTIKAVRHMTKGEMKAYAWYEPALVIEFTDGTFMIPSKDPEGNGPGALFIIPKDGDMVTLA